MPIGIEFWLRFKIIFLSCFEKCHCCCREAINNDRDWEVYSEGALRLDSSLDVIKLVQRLRKLKILTNILAAKGVVNKKLYGRSHKYIINANLNISDSEGSAPKDESENEDS